MDDIPDKNTFAPLYSGQPPWDIGRPQKALLDVADQITCSILDAGCGTGDNALFSPAEATRSLASTTSKNRFRGPNAKQQNEDCQSRSWSRMR
jgi:hypothetical protein